MKHAIDLYGWAMKTPRILRWFIVGYQSMPISPNTL